MGCESKPLRSARENPTIVKNKINKEISLGRVAGPFESYPMENFISSPIGLVPKQNPGTFRMIHHLSYPEKLSVNDEIPPEFSAVTYTTVETAINSIKVLDASCFLAKTDIESAFRSIPVHPSDYPFLGFEFDDLFYYNKTLPMGLSSLPKIFEEFSKALEFLISAICPEVRVHHMIDDFLFIANT